MRLKRFYSNIQKRQEIYEMREEKKKKIELREKTFEVKFNKKAKEAEALRTHLLEKKQEKVMMIKHRK
jgi:hypothetical protein